eukprot:1526837-Rhodomonas_salina.4
MRTGWDANLVLGGDGVEGHAVLSHQEPTNLRRPRADHNVSAKNESNAPNARASKFELTILGC